MQAVLVSRSWSRVLLLVTSCGGAAPTGAGAQVDTLPTAAEARLEAQQELDRTWGASIRGLRDGRWYAGHWEVDVGDGLIVGDRVLVDDRSLTLIGSSRQCTLSGFAAGRECETSINCDHRSDFRHKRARSETSCPAFSSTLQWQSSVQVVVDEPHLFHWESPPGWHVSLDLALATPTLSEAVAVFVHSYRGYPPEVAFRAAFESKVARRFKLIRVEPVGDGYSVVVSQYYELVSPSVLADPAVTWRQRSVTYEMRWSIDANPTSASVSVPTISQQRDEHCRGYPARLPPPWWRAGECFDTPAPGLKDAAAEAPLPRDHRTALQ